MGGDDFVELGNPARPQLTGSMTVSAWVNSAAFPSDDAAIVSKRTSGEIGYQLDTTVDRGPRTVGFKLTNSAGGSMFRYGATTLQANTWYHVTGVYNAATSTLHVYLNGQLDDGTLVGTVTATQQNSSANVNIGRRPTGSFNFNGRIDDVRIYGGALTQAEIQADMNTPVGGSAGDPTAPTAPASLTATAAGPTQVNLSWSAATDNVAVTGYRVERCQGAGCTTFAEIAAPSGTGTTYNDTTVVANSTYRYRVRATDAAPNLGPYSPIATATTPTAADTTPPTAPASLTATAACPTQVNLSWVGGDRQRRGHRLPRGALPGCRVHHLRRDRRPQRHRHHVQRHDRRRQQHLPLPRPRHRRRPQPRPLQPDRDRNHPDGRGHDAADGTGEPDCDRGRSTQVNLSWSAATDNVAVTGYRVERCQGAGCTTFAEIAAPSGTGTTYNDTTVVANSTYRYRVRATDAAPNLGPYRGLQLRRRRHRPAAGLIAAYAFNEGAGTSAADASGGGLTGTLTNGAAWGTGRNAGAVQLDGVNDFVELGNPALLQLRGA